MAEFRSFAALLAAPAPVAPLAPSPEIPAAAPIASIAPADAAAAQIAAEARPHVAALVDEATRELILLRARVADALEAAADTLLAELARDVLARELALRPVDIATLVARARAELRTTRARIRVAPGSAHTGEVHADPALRPGDVVIETDDGEIDLRVGSRLEALLDGVAVQA